MRALAVSLVSEATPAELLRCEAATSLLTELCCDNDVGARALAACCLASSSSGAQLADAVVDALFALAALQPRSTLPAATRAVVTALTAVGGAWASAEAQTAFLARHTAALRPGSPSAAPLAAALLPALPLCGGSGLCADWAAEAATALRRAARSDASAVEAARGALAAAAAAAGCEMDAGARQTALLGCWRAVCVCDAAAAAAAAAQRRLGSDDAAPAESTTALLDEGVAALAVALVDNCWERMERGGARARGATPGRGLAKSLRLSPLLADWTRIAARLQSWLAFAAAACGPDGSGCADSANLASLPATAAALLSRMEQLPLEARPEARAASRPVRAHLLRFPRGARRDRWLSQTRRAAAVTACHTRARARRR